MPRLIFRTAFSPQAGLLAIVIMPGLTHAENRRGPDPSSRRVPHGKGGCGVSMDDIPCLKVTQGARS
ncbi:hypothetical protein [uncultured Rhodoblastus sp.]|uniref:hypothetical protein n=1 Tax=uncultured Rhodoblastus sp. TaxID=543037 RepID=UPI0025CFF56B|nr:hypothetical protein [uncultured Rhodoblastus sp.]